MDGLRLDYVLMAHYAQIDENGIVLQVIVVNNADEMNGGVPDEATGIAFCQMLFGVDTLWKKTSYNGNIRKNFAGISYAYDSGLDAFIPPKPAYDDVVLDETTARWTSATMDAEIAKIRAQMA